MRSKLQIKHERHGKRHTREYRAYTNMKQRCHNLNHPSYSNYGGRGITVCDEWRDSYMKFYEDMGDCPENYSLERKDNSKGYSKSNCIWATRSVQCINKRVPKNNKSGVKGVCWSKDRKRWVSTIGLNGKRIYLGEFIDKEDAIKARRDAENKLHNPLLNP